MQKLDPKPGMGFVLREAGTHQRLRSLMGKTGRIADVHPSGLLFVQFPETRVPMPLPPAFGEVVPASALVAASAQTEPAAGHPARVFRIEVPLPFLELSPNARPNRFAKADATKRYRAAVGEILCQQVFTAVCVHPLRTPAVLDLDFYQHRPTYKDTIIAVGRSWYAASQFAYPTDADNARASFKAGQDALADAGVLANDDAKHLVAGYTRIHSGAEAGGKTYLLMTLTEAEATK